MRNVSSAVCWYVSPARAHDMSERLLLPRQHRGICRHCRRCYSMYFPQESGICFLYLKCVWVICLIFSMLSCWINRSYKRGGEWVCSQNKRNCRFFSYFSLLGDSGLCSVLHSLCPSTEHKVLAFKLQVLGLTI